MACSPNLLMAVRHAKVFQITFLYFYFLPHFSYANSFDSSSMITLFSVECKPYFDWQTVGMMHSYRKSRQPGPILRLLSCTENDYAEYKNMDLAPTFKVPSLSIDPETNDIYPAINKPAGVVHWLNHHPAAQEVEWVVILDADQIIRSPITPWGLNAEKGKPVSAYYGYLIGCDNILAKLHTKNPQLCDKVGGFIVMHIDDLKKFAPLWLSKTKEVRADKAHYSVNITGDIFSSGWISEMYGYSFGAADVGLRHKIRYDVMLYPGYIPIEDTEPLLFHYGLRFGVNDWTFGKSSHYESRIVDECNHLFPSPPLPNQVKETGRGEIKRDLLSIECMNTINEGLLIHHLTHGCPPPLPSPYISLLKNNFLQVINNKQDNKENKIAYSFNNNNLLRGRTNDDIPLASVVNQFLSITSNGQFISKNQINQQSIQKNANSISSSSLSSPSPPSPPSPPPPSNLDKNVDSIKSKKEEKKNIEKTKNVQVNGDKNNNDDNNDNKNNIYNDGIPNMITLFSAECNHYFDWQTLGLMYSYKRSGQPGTILRLLSCTEEQLKSYKGMNLAPTMLVPSYSIHPVTGDNYPAINKPVAIQYWLQHSPEAQLVDWVLILDDDMLLRYPITPKGLGARKGWVISAPYEYLIGCDNILAQLHINNTKLCDKVGGYYMMHVHDLRRLAPLWISKTEEVRADRAHYATNITGDIYGQGWISEMYGYSFGASEAGLRHVRNDDIMLYPGYPPNLNTDPKLLHYGLTIQILDWEFDKSGWAAVDLANTCSKYFPKPPKLTSLPASVRTSDFKRDLISKECVDVLNRALREHHLANGCGEEGEMSVDGEEEEVFDLLDASLIGNEGKGEGDMVSNPGNSFFVNKSRERERERSLSLEEEEKRFIRAGEEKKGGEEDGVDVNGEEEKVEEGEDINIDLKEEDVGKGVGDKEIRKGKIFKYKKFVSVNGVVDREKGDGEDKNGDKKNKDDNDDDSIKDNKKVEVLEMKKKEMEEGYDEESKHDKKDEQGKEESQSQSQSTQKEDVLQLEFKEENQVQLDQLEKEINEQETLMNAEKIENDNVNDNNYNENDVKKKGNEKHTQFHLFTHKKDKRRKIFQGRNFFDKAKAMSLTENFISDFSMMNVKIFLAFLTPWLLLLLGFTFFCFSLFLSYFRGRGRGRGGGNRGGRLERVVSRSKSNSKSKSTKQSSNVGLNTSLVSLVVPSIFSKSSKDTTL